MKHTLFKLLIFLFFIIPYLISAEVVTIEDVDVKIQPNTNGEFQLFIGFELPKLPENIKVDYAIITMGVNVLSNPDTLTMTFEILTDVNSTRESLVNYNANPVTTFISRKQKGPTKIELDITQIVRLWVNEGESIAPGFMKPTVRIFYTVLD